MARDLSLTFHGSASGGTTLTSTLPVTLPSIDLGSNSVNRTLLLERRVMALSGSAGFNLVFQDSEDGVTFSMMPGAVTGTTQGHFGFKTATTTIYGSTDAVAAKAPDSIVVRTDKRYIRGNFIPGTTFTSATFSVMGKVLGAGTGAFTGAVGPLNS